MKPEDPLTPESVEAAYPITGDVIGDTAYSERFVLKILLKFANLNSLKDEIKRKTFEGELCTLWDMTAEKDVVLFLQNHDTLKLIKFAMPDIKENRITEIIIGILGNMCCVKDVAASLLEIDDLLALVMEYLSSSDVHLIIQVLRLINACLYSAEEVHIAKWLVCFESIDYMQTLNYILQNSANKEVLKDALENLNTICSQCNVEQCRSKFFALFVNTDTLDSLTTAFIELTAKQEEFLEKDELERILAISLQITLNLVGFDGSLEQFEDRSSDISDMLKTVLDYYEDYFVFKKQIDTELVDLLDSSYTIVKVLELSKTSDLEQFFNQSYNIYVTCSSILSENETSEEKINSFAKNLKIPASNIISLYLLFCNQDSLEKVFDKVHPYFDDILASSNEADICNLVYERTKNLRLELDENRRSM